MILEWPVEIRTFQLMHWLILGLTCVLAVGLGLLARQGERRRAVVVWALVCILIAYKIATFSYSWATDRLWIGNALPMHLCDWATFIVAAALLTRSRFLCDLSYFWGLGATIHAVITPNLTGGVPLFYCVGFFVSHIGIIVSVMVLVIGFGYRPDWKSLLRAMLWTQVYAAAAFTTNILSGANYGFLMAKPEGISLLDLLAPWPWYILQLEVLMVVLCGLLLLPFIFGSTHRTPRTAPLPSWNK